MRPVLIALALASACGHRAAGPADAAGPIPPARDDGRDVIETDLAFDVAARTATATITLAPSASTGASFEIGDLDIDGVTMGGAPLAWTDAGARLDVGVPATTQPLVIAIAYRWHFEAGQMGASTSGWTVLWPYWCGNLFPCRSAPADGLRFKLTLSGVAAGSTAVYPTAIDADAPPYQIAWAIGPYQRLDLGATAAGTQVHVWYFPKSSATAAAGSAHLRQAIDWFEQTLGPYPFGGDVGTVEAAWGAGAYGGMEHHPYWHVGGAAIGDEVTQVHESAHGWFGDGVRIACWEDFVMSEGTVSYLAARALEVVDGPARGDAVWAQYADQLAGVEPGQPVWPDGCNTHDILASGLFSQAPYMRGAFFYRGVAQKIGADRLDHALATFYRRYRGQAAHMSDVLDVIQRDTGYDPTACAQIWLKDAAVPQPGPCP